MNRENLKKNGDTKAGEEKSSAEKSRRSFVKKAVYTVPKLVLLGSFLSRPIKVRADQTGGPPGPPDDWL